MALFLSLFPVYLFGNLHCIGMCGPLVMMIGKHRFRYFYFLGRMLSFALAGFIAGGLGSVIGIAFKEFYLGAILSFCCGFMMLALGVCYLFKWNFPYSHTLAKKLAPFSHKISLLMLNDKPLTTFLFGFSTLLLPCGQTLIVFSACALYGSGFAGLWNGFAFAFLTSPSLYISMQAYKLVSNAKQHYHKFIGISAMLIGTLAILRGLADLDFISHWVLHHQAFGSYHLVMY